MTATSAEQHNRKFREALQTLLDGKGLSIEKLSELTDIPVRFLDHLINERFEKLPPAPYVRGYLMKIGETLGSDGHELWRVFQEQNKPIKKSGSEDKLPSNRFEPKRVAKRFIVIGAVVFLLGGYVTFRYNDLFGKPMLTIESPADNTVTTASMVTLRGKIDPKDTLTINAETVYVDEDGVFEKEFSLQPGINTIEFASKKLLGKTTTAYRRVIYNEQQQRESR